MKGKKGIKKILGTAACYLIKWIIGISLGVGLFPSLLDLSTVRAQKLFKEPTKKVEIKQPKRRHAFLIKGYDSIWFLPWFHLNRSVKNITCGYEALKKAGYTDDDIVVFSSREIKLNGKDIVDYKVNKGGPSSSHVLYDAFDDLSKKVGPEDSLFVFFAGHGGKGFLPLEKDDIVYYSELERLLSKVKSLYSVAFIDSCLSGDVAHRIGKGNIISISTTKKGRSMMAFNKFPKFVFSAVAGNSKADYDKNGKISIEEVFDYATTNSPTCRQLKSPSDILAYIWRYSTLRLKITPQLVYQNVDPAEVYVAEVAK